jgi:hypothetical protein
MLENSMYFYTKMAILREVAPYCYEKLTDVLEVFTASIVRAP